MYMYMYMHVVKWRVLLTSRGHQLPSCLKRGVRETERDGVPWHHNTFLLGISALFPLPLTLQSCGGHRTMAVLTDNVATLSQSNH